MEINAINDLLENANVETQEQDEENVDINDAVVEEDQQEEQEEDTEQEEQEDSDTEEEENTDTSTEEVTLQNLTQFADYLDISPEEAYGIEIPMPHGEAPITISALKDEVIEYRRNKQIFESEKSKFQQEVQQFQDSQNSLPNLSEEMLNVEAALRAVDSQINSTQWDQIEDAGQAALYRQQLNDAKTQLQNKKQEVLQKEQKASHDRYVQQVTADWQETVKVIPEWRDEGEVKKDKGKISNLTNSYGFQDSEVFSISDPRIIRLLRDYTLLRERVDKNSIAAKRVIRKGITLPNKGKKVVSDSQRKQLASKINRAKKTQDRRDINDAVTNLLNL